MKFPPQTWLAHWAKDAEFPSFLAAAYMHGTFHLWPSKCRNFIPTIIRFLLELGKVGIFRSREQILDFTRIEPGISGSPVNQRTRIA